MAPARTVDELFLDMYLDARLLNDSCRTNQTITQIYHKHFEIKDCRVAKYFLSVERM